jgi:8-oxo-dGTP pyrophosphatase MutT (NUDIX family)
MPELRGVIQYYCRPGSFWAMTFAANPRPAATVIVLRDGTAGPEVFLVRRHERTAFMGGAHVFPGGRVEPADRDGADASWCEGLDVAMRQLPALPPADAVAFHVAAVRELFEEAGVLLARGARRAFVPLADGEEQRRFREYSREVHLGRRSLREIVEREHLTLALDALVPFAHWVTPPIDVRQFDTRFFLTRVPPAQTPAHDQRETTESAWMTPAQAIDAARQDRIVLPPPTWTTLRELEPFTSVEAAVAWARQRDIVRRQPLLLERDGLRTLVMPGDPLHPDPPGRAIPPEVRFVQIDGRWRARGPGT